MSKYDSEIRGVLQDLFDAGIEATLRKVATESDLVQPWRDSSKTTVDTYVYALILPTKYSFFVDANKINSEYIAYIGNHGVDVVTGDVLICGQTVYTIGNVSVLKPDNEPVLYIAEIKA